MLGNLVFQSFNKILDVKIKMLKKEGKENIIYKFVIVFEDLIKLKILSVFFC